LIYGEWVNIQSTAFPVIDKDAIAHYTSDFSPSADNTNGQHETIIFREDGSFWSGFDQEEIHESKYYLSNDALVLYPVAHFIPSATYQVMRLDEDYLIVLYQDNPRSRVGPMLHYKRVDEPGSPTEVGSLK